MTLTVAILSIDTIDLETTISEINKSHFIPLNTYKPCSINDHHIIITSIYKHHRAVLVESYKMGKIRHANAIKAKRTYLDELV